MIKCYRIQLESVPKVPRNFTISSYFIIENNLVEIIGNQKPIASYNTGELFYHNKLFIP